MDVFIDNRPLDTDARTLGEIIDAARSAAGGDGRMIVEVRIDGRTLAFEELEASSGAEPAGAEVQLVTAEPRDLAVYTLGEVSHVLAAARQDQKRAADLLSADQTERAHEPLAATLEAWSHARQAVAQVAELLAIDVSSLEAGDRRGEQVVRELADRLDAVRRQITAGDWLALADTLAYELDETAERWVQLIEAMIAKVKSPERP